MKKEIIINFDSKKVKLVYSIECLLSAKELSILLKEIATTKKRLVVQLGKEYSFSETIRYKNQKFDNEFFEKAAKITLANLDKNSKKRLLAKPPAFDIKEKKLIFKIDEIFLPTLKKAKNYIEHTMNFLNAPIHVSWFHDTDIKIREKIEITRQKKVYHSFIEKKIHNYNKKSYKSKMIVNIKNLKDLANYPSGTRVAVHAKIALIRIKNRYVFFIEDETGDAKIITYRDEQKKIVQSFKKGDIIYAEGSLKHDKETKEQIIWFIDMYKADSTSSLSNDTLNKDSIKDNTKVQEKPRFELHCHTKMSAYDGVSDITDYYTKLKELGHQGIAITDNNCVQAFPEAATIQNKDQDFKFIFGVELTTLENNLEKLPANDISFENCDFIFFDLETTGLFCEYDSILEVAMKKVKGDSFNFFEQNNDTLHFFVKQQKTPSKNTLKFTGITIEDLKKGIDLIGAINRIDAFIKSSKNPILVAHNAFFDFTFLKKAFSRVNKNFPSIAIIDTLAVSRLVLESKKSYALGKVAREFKIHYDSKAAHRANYDVNVLTKIWFELKDLIVKKYGILSTKQLKAKTIENLDNWERRTVVVLCKNEQGKKSLYELLTLASTKYLNKTPQIPFYEIEKRRKNFLIGSSGWNGHVFKNALENNLPTLDYWIKKMDYIEIQPIDVFSHLLTDSFMDVKNIQQVLTLIVNKAIENQKTIVATSDCYYANDKDKIIRDIYINTKGLKGVRHEFYKSLATKLDEELLVEGPNQPYRSTTNMLEEFSFLKDIINIEDLVINNSFKIANQCMNFQIKPKGLFPAEIKNIDTNEWLLKTSSEKAAILYANKIPDFVIKRMNKESEILTKHNYSAIYYISAKLVEECNKRKSLVGSRGSVGSSIIAFLLGITEVNPLNPHYFCDKCGYWEFYKDSFVSSFDMIDKKCHNCDCYMKKMGMGIPFETFLGFNGEKTPDIDLNLSTEYQLWSHNFIKSMLGENKAFRVGVVSATQERTAYAIFMNYNDLLPKSKKLKGKDIMISKISGVKRTTGQHPGGIILLPENKDVHYFTPLQYPSNDPKKQKTTHFDSNFLHDNLFKIDLLAQGDPAVIGHLMRITKKHVKDINYNDSELIKLFSDCTIMDIKPSDINGETTGSIALPEFGTKKTRQIIKAFKPTSFADLVRISGISHGDGVWKGNIENLVKKGVAVENLVTCRDDIMNYLSKHSVPLEICFSIMEKVRKGIQLTNNQHELMIKHNVPQQYIEMCKKINYLFPKAHAVAYVIMAYRCAYYKLHHKVAFYCAHFTWKGQKFPYIESQYDIQELTRAYETLKVLTKRGDLEEKKFHDLEIVMEMKARKIAILLPSLNKASANEYIEIKGKDAMMIPFMALDGFGKIGEKIVEERERSLFKSYDDFKNRVKINIAQDKLLKKLGLTKF